MQKGQVSQAENEKDLGFPYIHGYREQTPWIWEKVNGSREKIDESVGLPAQNRLTFTGIPIGYRVSLYLYC